MRNTNRYNDCLGHDREGESGRIDESKSGQSRLIAETNGPPEEKTVEGKPVEAAQQPVESKPVEAAENSAATTATAPPIHDLYDWASKLTSEAGNGFKDYYWTGQMEGLVIKLKLTKRALIGVTGVQGVGKSAAMRAIEARLGSEIASDKIVAVKVPESGGLTNAFKAVFGQATDYDRVEELVDHNLIEQVSVDAVLLHRVRRFAERMSDAELMEQVKSLDEGFGVKRDMEESLSLRLRGLVPQRIIRELEREAMQRLLESQRIIMIDMPDYPKHDRRLIARDLDEVQGFWNRFMVSGEDISLVIFLQKETFDYADHYFYGKMRIVDLMPLTTVELLEAYKQRWGGYAPFTEDAIQYIAKMSRGIFRKFKRYIALTLEMSSQPPLDLELITKAVDEELMRDVDKELEGIFRKREQKEKALEVMKVLSDEKIRREEARAGGVKNTAESYGEARPDGLTQSDLAEMVDLSEMALSRLVRELEQHGYVKRIGWQHWTYVEENW